MILKKSWKETLKKAEKPSFFYYFAVYYTAEKINRKTYNIQNDRSFVFYTISEQQKNNIHIAQKTAVK